MSEVIVIPDDEVIACSSGSESWSERFASPVDYDRTPPVVWYDHTAKGEEMVFFMSYVDYVKKYLKKKGTKKKKKKKKKKTRTKKQKQAAEFRESLDKLAAEE